MPFPVSCWMHWISDGSPHKRHYSVPEKKLGSLILPSNKRQDTPPEKPSHLADTAESFDWDAADHAGAFGETFRRFLGCAGVEARWEDARAAYEELLGAPGRDRERFCFESERKLREEKRAFISFNNAVVKSWFKDKKPESALLLLPFCVQHTSCPHRIVWNVQNCKRCGKCLVAKALEAAEPPALPVRVAIRGIFAPRFVREMKPEITLAIACEDELFEGILRAAPYRCFGVLGTQPEGYCINTQFPISELQAALQYFLVR